MHVSEGVQEQLPVSTSLSLFPQAPAFPLSSSSSDRSRAASPQQKSESLTPRAGETRGAVFSSVSYWLYECPFSKMFGSHQALMKNSAKLIIFHTPLSRVELRWGGAPRAVFPCPW